LDPQDDLDRTHNPKVVGSNPIPATREHTVQSRSLGANSSVSQTAIRTTVTVYDFARCKSSLPLLHIGFTTWATLGPPGVIETTELVYLLSA